jgi:RNA polymerase sigma-19 factor, ECF subfamily
MQIEHPVRQRLVRELYIDHHGWLFGWLRKKLRCPSDAADLAQDTFVRVMQSDGLAQLREPRAFLTTTAGRLLIDHLRRRKLEQSYLAAIALHAPDVAAPSAEEHQAALETLAALSTMLEMLPPKPRQAFLMYRLEGVPHADIAARLGVSVSMVKQYLAAVLMQCYRVLHG